MAPKKPTVTLGPSGGPNAKPAPVKVPQGQGLMASPKVTVPPPRDAVADSSEFGWGNTTISREQVMSRLHAQAHNAAGIAKRKADRAAFVAAHPETAPATTTAAPTTPTTRRHKGPGHVRNPRRSHRKPA